MVLGWKYLVAEFFQTDMIFFDQFKLPTMKFLKTAIFCFPGITYFRQDFHKQLVHYENTSMQYTAIFHGWINDNFQIKIDIFLSFCSKHRLWVHVRTAVLTTTHNLCFRAKIRKLCIPL